LIGPAWEFPQENKKPPAHEERPRRRQIQVDAAS
jgi:hypothetical protein